MALTLYVANYRYSSWSLRAWLALHHAGVAFTVERIALKQPDTAARIASVSPSGRLPALHDGEVRVWDSLAICEYVHERHPASGLWPGDPAARAVARSLAAEMHSGFAAIRNGMPFNCCAAGLRVARTPELDGDIARVSDALTTTRARFGGGGPWLCGTFTIADAMWVPLALRFAQYGVALPGAAGAYVAAAATAPGYAAWLARAAEESERIPAYEPR